MTGSIHVHMVQNDGHVQRTLSLIPQIGHATTRTEVPWLLESVAAVTTRHPVARQDPATEEGAAREDGSREAANISTPKPPVENPELRIEDSSTRTPASTDVKEPSVESAENGLELTVHDETRGQTFEDRPTFTEELQLYFEDYETSGTPFVLVAMRMEDAYDRNDPDEFGSVSRVVEDSLHREDSMFIDPGTERIIIILGEENGGAAQQLFARIKDRMRTEMPEHADQMMNAVSAVVVKNGSPFVTASEFLAYVLDED